MNPVRELYSLTTIGDGIEPPSIRNDLYHRQESVAFSNGVKDQQEFIIQFTPLEITEMSKSVY